MATALVYGVRIAHSNGQHPRPTKVGLRTLLTKRPDLFVFHEEHFDGMVDGMAATGDSALNDEHNCRENLLHKLSGPIGGLTIYVSEGGWGRAPLIRVASYVDSWTVYDPEALRRERDVLTLPGLSSDVAGRIAAAVRLNFLRITPLDGMGWDEALADLRDITTADALLCWLNARGYTGSTVALERSLAVAA